MRFVGTDVLLRRYRMEEIQVNAWDGHIVAVRVHEDDESVYRITEKGKHKRNDQ